MDPEKARPTEESVDSRACGRYSTVEAAKRGVHHESAEIPPEEEDPGYTNEHDVRFDFGFVILEPSWRWSEDDERTSVVSVPGS